MNVPTLRSVSLLALFALAAASQAVPVTYTLSALLSGSLDGVGFTNVSGTIVGVGDTDAFRVAADGVQTLTLQSLAVSGSFGSATFLTPSLAFLNRNVFGFSLSSEIPRLPGYFDFFDAFYGYDSSLVDARLDRALSQRGVLGAVTGFGRDPQATTAGLLQVSDLSSASLEFRGGLKPSSAVPGPVAALPFALMAIKRRKRA